MNEKKETRDMNARRILTNGYPMNMIWDLGFGAKKVLVR